MNPKLNRFLVASSDALAVIPSSAWAGNVFKANNPAALESGTSWTAGAIAVNSGGGSTITLNGTTADSAYLTWTDIPEPSSALLSGSGMLPLLLRRL